MPVHAASLADLADLVPLFSAYLDFYEVPSSNSIRCSPPWRYDLRGCSAISTSARRRVAGVSARP